MPLCISAAELTARFPALFFCFRAKRRVWIFERDWRESVTRYLPAVACNRFEPHEQFRRRFQSVNEQRTVAKCTRHRTWASLNFFFQCDHVHVRLFPLVLGQQSERTAGNACASGTVSASRALVQCGSSTPSGQETLCTLWQFISPLCSSLTWHLGSVPTFPKLWELKAHTMTDLVVTG